MPTPERGSFKGAPRMKNRAAAAITVVMSEQEGQRAKPVYKNEDVSLSRGNEVF